LLKVKKFLDTEVTVTSYEAGKGRHKGRVGALWVRLGNGKECKVGTGLKDKDRDNPPAVGSIITGKDQETTQDGLVRFPVYVGPRPDGNPNALPPTRKKKDAAPEPVPAPAPAKTQKATAAATAPVNAEQGADAPRSPKGKSETKPVSASKQGASAPG